MPTPSYLLRYWSDATLSVNLVVFANIFGALLLGLIAGYERTYHGRAAGKPLAGVFAEFIGSESARTVLRRYGFELPTAPVGR